MMATMLVDAIRRSMMTDSTDYQAPTSCAGHATTYSSSSAPEGRRTWTQATGGFANETNAVCAFGGEIQPLIQRWDGWEYVVEHSGKHRHRKPGFAAWRPGAKLDLCFSPPAAAIDRGEVFEWNLAYLRSYSQMGSARGECLRGCNCRPAVWNAHNGRARVSEHVTGTLRGIRLLRRVPSASRRCPCSIRLTVLNQTSSGGHKFKLVSVMTGFYMYSSKYLIRDAGCGAEAHELGTPDARVSIESRSALESRVSAFERSSSCALKFMKNSWNIEISESDLHASVGGHR
jgi:hypothetical protein